MGERYLFFAGEGIFHPSLTIRIYYLMKIISEMRGSKGSPKA